MLFVNAIPAGRTGFVPLVFDKASWLQVIREDESEFRLVKTLAETAQSPRIFLSLHRLLRQAPASVLHCSSAHSHWCSGFAGGMTSK